MFEKTRRFRPSPAMVVACLALLVALGGTAVAGGVLNKKKVNKIITNRAPGLSVKSAQTAVNASNADRLGGVSPTGYQGFCKAGAVKATLVVDTAGFTSTTFQNKPGFNCFQPGNTSTSVQLKHGATAGTYVVRFVGNSGTDNSGSAVCSGFFIQEIVSCKSGAGGTDAPGETVFNVTVTDDQGNPINDQAWSLLAF
jgi:hypothetical protein